jgi:hypothetical protein
MSAPVTPYDRPRNRVPNTVRLSLLFIAYAFSIRGCYNFPCGVPAPSLINL